MSRLPSLGPRGEGWFAAQLVLMLLILVSGVLAGPNWTGIERTVGLLIGGGLVLAGVLLVLIAARSMGGSVSPLPRPMPGLDLRRDGPYRYVRHPMYVGVVVGSAGWALLMASILSLALTLVLAVLLDLKARREELWLRERYPEYGEYARQTRRFVPGLY